MTTFGYSHLAVSVTDLDRGVAFYSNVLGFRAGTQYRSAGRRVAALMESQATQFGGVFLRRCDVLVELLRYDPPLKPAWASRPPEEVGYAHISLVVDDVDSVVASAAAYGGAQRTRFETSFADGISTIAFISDSDGNRVELIGHSSVGERNAHAAFLGLDGLGWPATGLLPGAPVAGSA
jgi:catechol 2,3-dioxygenase-like lactoylglutathione lyase family enzyme